MFSVTPSKCQISPAAGSLPELSASLKLAVVGTALFFALSACAAPLNGVCMNDNFEAAGKLADLGWQVSATPEQSEWSIRDGYVEVVGHRNPYKGGFMTKQIPVLERGILEFDAMFATSGRTDYQHFSLGFRLYGHLTAFKNYGTHAWLQHRPQGNTWATLATAVPFGKWVHIKVVFDFPAKRTEYYCGPGEDPVFVDPALELDLAKAPKELVFFNYGLCNGTVTNRIDNITLRGWEDPRSDAHSSRNGLVLFEGMTADRYGTQRVLAARSADDAVSVYPLMTRGAAIAPRNIFRLQRVPGRRRLDEAALIVLADVPAMPNECLPEYLLKDIAFAVHDGAHLLVLAGMFALGKGGYQDTALAELIPFGQLSPWDGQCFDTPEPMTGPLLNPAPGKQAPPTVLWHHAPAKTAAKAEILLQAGERPMALRWTVGKGTVTVFLGMACGDYTGTNATSFWTSDQWPQLLGKLATPTKQH